MAIIIDNKNSLDFIRNKLNIKFNNALNNSINSSNIFNNAENIQKNCRRTINLNNINSQICPIINFSNQPYFNECKKNKIFNNNNNLSNPTFKLSKIEEYVRFTKKISIDGKKIITYNQNSLLNNFNSNKNVINICKISELNSEIVPESETIVELEKKIKQKLFYVRVGTRVSTNLDDIFINLTDDYNIICNIIN